jgi:RimJ/RimL family protein N-acetyltransferase
MTDLSEWTPCERPRRETMEGRFVRLEPLSAARHGDELFAASSVPDAEERFRWLPDRAPLDRNSFQPWLEQKEASADPLYFAVIAKKSGTVAGRQSLMRIDTANGVGEIGDIYWGPAISRTPATTEAFYLFARHLFDDLGYRRYEWKCDNANAPSRRAAERFGMTAEGLFRQHRVVKGLNRDTAWFALLDSEWPLGKAAMEAWLAPGNFDAEGRQRRRLGEIREALRKEGV